MRHGKEYGMMKALLAVTAITIIGLAGCGVNKDYVSEQISASEARTGAKVSAIESKAQANEAQLKNLQALASELQNKTDMALNEAKGFENYQIIWQGEVNFAYDSYDIDDIASGILNEAGEKMNASPGSLMEIAGYTDPSGSKKYNLLLGEKRANSVKRYLTENYGVSLYRTFIISYGEDKPVALPDEKNANSKNRRVKLTLWGRM